MCSMYIFFYNHVSAKSSYQLLSQTAKAQERIARAKRSWEKCAHSQKQNYKRQGSLEKCLPHHRARLVVLDGASARIAEQAPPFEAFAVAAALMRVRQVLADGQEEVYGVVRPVST